MVNEPSIDFFSLLSICRVPREWVKTTFLCQIADRNKKCRQMQFCFVYSAISASQKIDQGKKKWHQISFYRVVASSFWHLAEDTIRTNKTRNTTKANKAKSRKYRGVFNVKSRVKTWQVRGIPSQPLEHKQVPKRGRHQVSGRVSAPFWYATPVANAPWKPLLIRQKSSSVCHWFRVESGKVVSTISTYASPQKGAKPGVRRGKRSLLTYHTRCLICEGCTECIGRQQKVYVYDLVCSNTGQSPITHVIYCFVVYYILLTIYSQQKSILVNMYDM